MINLITMVTIFTNRNIIAFKIITTTITTTRIAIMRVPSQQIPNQKEKPKP